MTYFVVSDIHAFYTELKKALAEKGFDESNPDHKLIICGEKQKGKNYNFTPPTMAKVL